LIAVAAALAIAVRAMAQSPEVAADRMEVFLSGFPDLGPGYAVVAVTADDVVLNRVWGERHSASAEPLNADTPIYIASQTKAFMGLLAARLDAEGVLSLDSTLAEHWGGVTFPERVDPHAWTLRDLLSHQVPLESELITFLEAYVTDVDPADYPTLIGAASSAREPGFRYANIGYNLYGAILHSATGRPWQDWLADSVFAPLQLTRTSARTSDFPLSAQSWNHIWTGRETGWFDIRPKTDRQMQSAGGVVMSPNDMVTWLQMNLRGEGPDGSGLTKQTVSAYLDSAVERSHDERNAYELPCYGYALGWNICDFQGHEVYIHGGGYTGARTMMAFSPDLDVGIGVFSNSDNMTGWLTSRTVVQFLQFVVDDPEANQWMKIRHEQYPQRIERLLDHRRAEIAEARQNPVFEGWNWAPDRAALGAYSGVYSNPAMNVRVLVELQEGELAAAFGDYRLTARPAAPDMFGAQVHPMQAPETLVFERNAEGDVVALAYRGFRFERR